MKKRRLISVMIAGMMTASAGTMAGCTTDYQFERDVGTKKFRNAYIVLESKDEKIMHKGNYEVLFVDPSGYGYAGTGLLKLDFACRDEYLTNAPCYIYKNKPSKSDYDVVCEDCFTAD